MAFALCFNAGLMKKKFKVLKFMLKFFIFSIFQQNLLTCVTPSINRFLETILVTPFLRMFKTLNQPPPLPTYYQNHS